MAKQQAKKMTGTSSGEIASDDQEQSGIINSETSEAEEDYIYGLASVLYHALQGVNAARKYVEDARRAGADELLEFFEECRSEAEARAQQAKALLVAYSQEEEDEADGGDTSKDEDDDDDDDDDDDGPADSVAER